MRGFEENKGKELQGSDAADFSLDQARLVKKSEAGLTFAGQTNQKPANTFSSRAAGSSASLQNYSVFSEASASQNQYRPEKIRKNCNVHEDEADNVAASVDEMLAGGSGGVVSPNLLPEKVKVSPVRPGSAANDLNVYPGIPVGGGTASLAAPIRRAVEAVTGTALPEIRVHSGGAASRYASTLRAEAFTRGRDIYLGGGKTQRDVSLLSHEATHVIQQERSGAGSSVGIPGPIQRKATPGEQAVDYFWAQLDQQTNLKTVVDRLKSAAREIARNTSLEYLKKVTPALVEQAADILKLSAADKAALIAEWQGYLDNPATFTPAKQAAFFARLQSPLSKISASYPNNEAVYRLQHTPPQIMDLIYTVAAEASFPADELWVYAAREGLVDYVRDSLGLSGTASPSRSDLNTVRTDQPVSGFSYLGLDDYFTDLRDANLGSYLPATMDQTRMTPESSTNEKGRVVESARAADMKTALYALAGMLKQRRDKFIKDAAKYGYAGPSQEELVYWTYIYFNTGQYGGEAQLKKYQGQRKLGDWIKKGEYLNAIKVLQTWKAAKEIYQGFSVRP